MSAPSKPDSEQALLATEDMMVTTSSTKTSLHTVMPSITDVSSPFACRAAAAAAAAANQSAAATTTTQSTLLRGAPPPIPPPPSPSPPRAGERALGSTLSSAMMAMTLAGHLPMHMPPATAAMDQRQLGT